MPYQRICISSGHGKYVRGASGILDEVDEARKVTERLAEELRRRGVEVMVFHDNTSKNQSDNLNAIVNWHNKQKRDLDVSVHFNAYQKTDKPMGTEVLWVTQEKLAKELSNAIATCGFINRGAKKRTDLKFLNATDMPAVLLETCFVDSKADADLYRIELEDICDALADVLGGKEIVEQPEEELPPVEVVGEAAGRVDIQVEGDIVVTVNGIIIYGEPKGD